MKLGEKLRATVKFIGTLMLMALLATLAMPISVHADTHTVNISTKPYAAGTTTPYDTSITVSSDEGAMVSVSTAANSGYTFLRWVAQYDIGRNITVNSPSATVVTQHLVNVYAEYVDNSTSGIVTKVADSSQGTATGTRPWSWGTDGQYFTISAVPNDPTKYEFDYWKKGGSKYSSSATVEVQMPKIDYTKYDSETGDAKNQVEYTAYFKEKSGAHGFRAIAGSDEGGNITGQPYLSYESWKASGNVSVTANPYEGYDFVKWVAPDGSDYSTNNNITVTYPSPEPSEDDKKNDIVYTAIFKPHDSKGISAEARLDSETGNIGGGSVSPSYVEWSDSNKNQAISFTANPDRNKKFVKWVVPDSLSVKSSLSNPNLSVVMPASKPTDNITITAVFAADEKHEVYFDVLGESNGSYSSGLGGTVTPPMIEPKDGENTSVNVQATPWDGYEFEKWELEDSSTTSVVLPADLTKSAISITVKKQEDVTSDVHIRAYFKKATNKGYWTYGVEGGDTSPRYTKWQSGGGSFTITATPKSGYKFDHWEKYDRKTGITNKLYSSDSTCSVPFDAQAPEDNIYFYAYFKKESGYGIYSYGIQGGDTSPRFTRWTEATKGTSVTLTATPYDGYVFDHWRFYNKETGEQLENYSKLSTISVKMPLEEMNESRYYYAVFKPTGDVGIQAFTTDAAAGSVSPADKEKWTTTNKGTPIAITATAKPGHVFDHWRYLNKATGETIENYSYSASTSVIMPEEMSDDICLYAVFKEPSKLGIYALGVEGGEASPKFSSWDTCKGQSISLAATPNPGYKFSHWRYLNNATGETIDNYSTNQNISVKMPSSELTDNIYYFAIFEKETDKGIYSYGIQGGDTTPRFTKWSDPTGPGAASSIILTATPETDYVFDHWRYYNAETGQSIENYSGLASISVKIPTEEMKDNHYYYAVFKKVKNLGIYSYGIEGGDTTPRYTQWSQQTANQSIQLQAIPDASKDYEFDHWRYLNKETGVTIENYSTQDKISVVMPSEMNDSHYYFAVFKKKEVVGIYSYGIEGGDTSPRFTQWSESTRNTTVNLRATPDEGYLFDHWRLYKSATDETIENYSVLPELSVTMPYDKPEGNIYYFAVFKKDENFGIYSYGIEGGDTNPRFTKWSEQTKSTSILLTATPNDGYVFDHWNFFNGVTTAENVSSSPSYSVTMPSVAMTTNYYYYAVFREIDGIGIYSQGVQGGETSPRHVPWNSSTKGTSITLTATPDKGYEFDHWSYYNKETGVTLQNYSKATSISVIMPDELVASRYYYAYFKKNNEKVKNPEIHVEGKQTGIAKEKYLDKWRTWIDPALKYVRSTIAGMAHNHTTEDARVYDGNKDRGYDSGKAAANLKSEIDANNQLKHSQSVDHPIISDYNGFSVSELSGLKAVFGGNVGAKTDDDAIAIAKEKYGELYKSEVVLAGDIYFENEDGERITGQPSKDSTDATVVINGVNTEDTDIWMLIYVDSASDEFIITPISDAATLIRFTLPDQFGGKITLLSVKYN